MQADRKLQERAQRSKDAARRFAIISELCALGYDAQYLAATQAIRVYNAPDGEGWRTFTTIDEANRFLLECKAIEDAGCLDYEQHG
jgi:hypothetical protein